MKSMMPILYRYMDSFIMSRIRSTYFGLRHDFARNIFLLTHKFRLLTYQEGLRIATIAYNERLKGTSLLSGIIRTIEKGALQTSVTSITYLLRRFGLTRVDVVPPKMMTT